MKTRPLGKLRCVQRDLLACVAANPGANGRELWTAVEEAQQSTKSDDTIYAGLDALVELGFIERTTSTTEHEYRLTLEGREILREDAEWLDSVR